MDVHGRNVLHQLKGQYPSVSTQVDILLLELESAEWKTPHELKARYPRASLLGDGLVVFDLKGNSFRVLARIAYKNQKAIILRAGTHADYDRWNLGAEREE